MEEIGRKKHSSTAMFLLFAEACTLLLLSAAVLACGFVLDMHDSYDTDYIDSQVDYTQYWVGFVFLITAFLTAAVAVRQRNRSLVITVLVLLLICIFVSLFALVVEGNDWVDHNTKTKTKGFWEDEDYTCWSTGTSCLCKKVTENDQRIISSDVDCDDLNKLSNIYGGIICCVLVGVFVALSSIVVIVILIPIKHFSLPEPKQRIRNITVLEDKPMTPPSPKIVYQKPPKPEVEEIVVREVPRQPQPQVVVREVERPPPRPQVVVREVERPPPRPQVVVREVERPPPRPQVIVKEVERRPPRPQVVVREVERPPPRPQVIVKEVERPPPPPQVIVREVERPAPPPQVIVQEVERRSRRQQQRSIVYDEPIPVQKRNFMAIEPAPLKQYHERRPTQKMISHVYDEGRLVTKPRSRPPMIIEKDFVRNPNFVAVPTRRMTRPESPVYIPQREVQRTGDWALMPVKKNSSRKHTPAYVVENPPAWERSRHTAKIIHTRSRSEERRPRQRMLRPQVVAPQRPRAYSDERPRLYTVQKPEPFAREVPGMFMGRPRANSDERPVKYQHSAARPRVYTDQEITQFYEEFPPRTGDRKTEYYQEHPPKNAKTEYYKEGRDGKAEYLREMPVQDGQVNDRKSEERFEPAANWDSRPSTPY